MSQSTISLAGGFDLSGIANTYRTLRAALADRANRIAVYRQTYAELDSMSDRDLADIGIARFMIADVAAEAAAMA